MTNADKIRTMTVEEMARFLQRQGSCPCEYCPKEFDFFIYCENCWENWLADEHREEV